ncbi:Unknown protein [Striga hermonthica]|uniref:Uncharacterized protein n=1 Tax=Striga hermonthica TaxID=68872 RepID=A0A9N7NS26_STRHE|nr:Unknown protein [Striga hermonthica]
MLEAKSLNKAAVPETLFADPSPANLQSTRLAVHANGDSSSCWVYVASGCRVYKLLIAMEDSSVGQGKESLLIPEHTQMALHIRYLLEILVLEKGVGLACALIQINCAWQLWHGVFARALIFMTKIFISALYVPTVSSNGYVATGGADRTVTIYDPRRWCAISRWLNCSKYEITGLTFSSVDPNYIYVQGVDYEVLCGQWKESKKAFSFRGDSNWLGFSKCSDRDILAGWCDSGSIFVADVF